MTFSHWPKRYHYQYYLLSQKFCEQIWKVVEVSLWPKSYYIWVTDDDHVWCQSLMQQWYTCTKPSSTYSYRAHMLPRIKNKRQIANKPIQGSNSINFGSEECFPIFPWMQWEFWCQETCSYTLNTLLGTVKTFFVPFGN